MNRRWGLNGALLGVSLSFMLGWLLWNGGGPQAPEWVRSLVQKDAVLVIVVDTQKNLNAVLGSVASDRVVASSTGGFAMDPHRIVVTSLDSAGDLVTTAGWEDRPLEIFDAGQRLRTDGVSNKKLDRISSLMNKPTLTRGEAYLLLSSM